MTLLFIRIFSAAFFLVLLAFGIAHSAEKREWEEILGDLDGIRRRTACFGLHAAEWWEKTGHRPDPRELHRIRALYVRGDARMQLRRRIGKRFEVSFLCLTVAAAAAFALSFVPAKDRALPEDSIERPSFGETENVSLNVAGWNPDQPEAEEEITVEVFGKDPEGEAMQQVFDEVFAGLGTKILGSNPSLDEVRTDLSLIRVTDWGIRVTWKSMDPQIVTDTGQVDNSEVPENGTVVTLQVELEYAGAHALYNLFVHVVPPEKNAAFYLGLLTGEIEKQEKSSRTSNTLKLPDQIDGRAVTYRLPRSKAPWPAVVFLALLGGIYIAADRSRLKEECEKRRKQLREDYPVFLFRLCTLLGCGMTQRAAWFRNAGSMDNPAADVREADVRAENSGSRAKPGKAELRAGDAWKEGSRGVPRVHYVYAEMAVTRTEIAAGKNEADAYRDFGQRCGLDGYIRTAGFLSQNAKQGTAGLRELLEAEMLQAFVDQKSDAVQKGEKMSTRMLLPMMLMLSVVMIVLMAPAILQMG